MSEAWTFLHCKPTRIQLDHQHSDHLSQTCVASVGAVAMHASLVGLPDLPSAVLKEIFEQVSLLDRLTCEQVCKSWRQTVRSPQNWAALYGTELSIILDDSTGISDIFLQGSKFLILRVAVPSLQSVPSFPSSFSLWLARRWPALTHVSIIDCCNDTGSPLENILATCTSSISGSDSGPEIKLRLGVYHEFVPLSVLRRFNLSFCCLLHRANTHFVTQAVSGGLLSAGFHWLVE